MAFRSEGRVCRRSVSRRQTHESTDYRPNENAAHRAQLDKAHSSATNDANGRKGGEGATTKAKANKDGSRARREGEHDAARFLPETAGSSEGIDPVWGQLTSEVDFPI